MKKKITALVLAVIMCLSFIISAGAADTLKRVPSTIPGTDKEYNYVENVTVKIPGTNVTFDFEKVADFVMVDNKVSYEVSQGDNLIKGELDIPVYHFYLFENAGKIKFNQDGMFEYGEVQVTDYYWAYPCPIEKGQCFLIDYDDEHNMGKDAKIIGNVTTIVSRDSILGYIDIDTNIEELKETAVAKVVIDMVCIADDEYFDYEHYYKLDNYDESIDISLLDVNYKPSKEYKITDGANSVVKSDAKSLKIKADGEFSKFTGVKVDGKTVDSSNYTASEGSTIIELHGEYLKTLKEGKHTVTVAFTDGEATTQFEIKKDKNTGTANKTDKPAKPDVEIPNTDTDSSVTAIFAVMALSGTAVIVCKKKKYTL